MKSIFITGVDTDIGKTFVCAGLCAALTEKGKKVGYFKPLQSGAKEADGRFIAPDSLEVEKIAKNVETKISYLFKGDVSPYLASILSGQEVNMNKIKNDYETFLNTKDFVVTEGAGGLYCPAFRGKLFYNIIKELNTEIIIVTTPSLGRLNHLLMTIECAKINDIKIKGVIINKVSKTPTLSEKNFIKEFKAFSDVDILAIIPKIENNNKSTIFKAFKDINL